MSERASEVIVALIGNNIRYETKETPSRQSRRAFSMPIKTISRRRRRVFKYQKQIFKVPLVEREENNVKYSHQFNRAIEFPSIGEEAKVNTNRLFSRTGKAEKTAMIVCGVRKEISGKNYLQSRTSSPC